MFVKLARELFIKFCCSLGNGRCDDTYNTEQCLYDFGDCCLPQGNKIMFIKYITLPTAEILSGKNVRAFLVCRFLMKSFKKNILKI